MNQLEQAARKALETFEHLPDDVIVMASVQIAMSELRNALKQCTACNDCLVPDSPFRGRKGCGKSY